MPTKASAEPRYVPCSGMAWRGSRATATRMRSRLPTMPLVGIEFDPAGARQVDLHPGVGRAAADIAMVALAVHEQISRHEARGDAEPAQRLDHEQRIVAAGAGSGLQRVERMLRAVLVPLAIAETPCGCRGVMPLRILRSASAPRHRENSAPMRTVRPGDRRIAARCIAESPASPRCRRETDRNRPGRRGQRERLGRSCSMVAVLGKVRVLARSSKVAIATLLPNTSWM